MRVSNKVAVDMYNRLGYVIYRRVLGYYSGDPDEDAFGESPVISLGVIYEFGIVLLDAGF